MAANGKLATIPDFWIPPDGDGNRFQLGVRAIIYRRLFLAETLGTLGMTTPPSAELGALRSFSFWDRRELNFLLGETSLP